MVWSLPTQTMRDPLTGLKNRVRSMVDELLEHNDKIKTTIAQDCVRPMNEKDANVMAAVMKLTFQIIDQQNDNLRKIKVNL